MNYFCVVINAQINERVAERLKDQNLKHLHVESAIRIAFWVVGLSSIAPPTPPL